MAGWLAQAPSAVRNFKRRMQMSIHHFLRRPFYPSISAGSWKHQATPADGRRATNGARQYLRLVPLWPNAFIGAEFDAADDETAAQLVAASR